MRIKTAKLSRAWAIAAIVCTVTLGALAGCASRETAAGSLTAEQVGQKIKRVVPLSEMTEGDAHKLERLYHIDAADVASFFLALAPTNMKADELAVIQVKDESQIAEVKADIKTRVDEQSQKFKDYVPEAYFLIENHVLTVKGRYVLFAVSKDAVGIERAFEEALK